MKRRIMRTVVVAAGTLMMLAAGNAAESFWIGGAEGSWNAAENWDPAGVPNVKDSVADNRNAIRMIDCKIAPTRMNFAE